MSIIYDFILTLGILAFSIKNLWKKKPFPSFRERFGLDVPNPMGRPVIWVHAVSVGEVKAAASLVEKIKREKPNVYLLVTTMTVTGQAEAKRSLTWADAICFLPFDYSWIMRKWAKRLNPKCLLFIESDFWLQLLQQIRSIGGKNILVSGKMSARSSGRFLKVPFFAKKLFSFFDAILVQNEEHQLRFAPFIAPEKLKITGNLKLDATPVVVDKERFRQAFQNLCFSVAITCTHEPEEGDLLDALQGLEGAIFLAPRHPERFDAIATLLQEKQIPFIRWSSLDLTKSVTERVILVDAMGQLPIVYFFCNLAIVGGSFSSQIGGHNVLEPCLYGIPVFFGPSMQQQKELAAHVLKAGAGKQVELSQLAEQIRIYIQDPISMRQSAEKLFAQSGKVLGNTWSAIEEFEKTWK